MASSCSAMPTAIGDRYWLPELGFAQEPAGCCLLACKEVNGYDDQKEAKVCLYRKRAITKAARSPQPGAESRQLAGYPCPRPYPQRHLPLRPHLRRRRPTPRRELRPGSHRRPTRCTIANPQRGARRVEDDPQEHRCEK